MQFDPEAKSRIEGSEGFSEEERDPLTADAESDD